MVTSGLDSQPDEVKTSVLLHSIGTDTLDVYNTFPVVDEVSQEDDQEESKFDRTMSNFDKYCLPRLNVTYERHRFFTRSQLSEETIDQYVTELRKLEKTCEFGVIGESLTYMWSTGCEVEGTTIERN